MFTNFVHSGTVENRYFSILFILILLIGVIVTSVLLFMKQKTKLQKEQANPRNLLSNLEVIEDLTTTETTLIKLLQDYINSRSNKQLDLIVVSDLNEITKSIWENFFVMSKDVLKSKAVQYHDFLENDAINVRLRNFVDHFGTFLLNEQFEKSQ